MTVRNWHAAVRAMKQDRQARPEIRFEPSFSQTARRLTAVSGIGTGAWRGRSERKYAVSAYTLANIDRIEDCTAVFIATTRDAAGEYLITSARSYTAGSGLLARWLEEVVRRGATEVHVHRIAPDEAARLAMMEDIGARPRCQALSAEAA